MHSAEIEESPIEVEPDHVLQVLPAPEQPAPVGDLRVAAHRANIRLDKGLHQLSDGMRLEDRVTVDQHEDLAPGQSDARVEGGGFPSVWPPDETHIRQA